MNEDRYRATEQRLWASVGVAPDERTLHLDRLDTDVRVQEVGEGPVVLFVHGGSASGANWAPLVGCLSGIRCVLLDRPGCGLSPPLGADLSSIDRFCTMADALLVDVADALDVPSVGVVATSLGGCLAIRGAAAHPDRIQRMVEFGYVPGARLTHLPLSMRVATLPGLRHVMVRIPPPRPMIRSIMRQLGHRTALQDGRITPELLDWFHSLLRDTPTMRNDANLPREVLPTRGANSVVLPTDLLAGVPTPIRFVWGDADPIGGPDVAREFVASFRDAELELWPDVGHAPWIDDAPRAADLVADFLGG